MKLRYLYPLILAQAFAVATDVASALDSEQNHSDFTAFQAAPTKKPTRLTKATKATKRGQPTPPPTTSVTNVKGQINVPIYANTNAALTVILPSSDRGSLLTLSQVSEDSENSVPVSRCYDGHEWEVLHPLLLPVECAASCTIALPPYTGSVNMYYIIEEYIPRAKTSEQDFAKLLLQGTYGPTQESLQEAMALGSAAAWVADQMQTPPTFLREHYRKRTNGYLKTDLHHHATRLACEPGSRWNRHAFNRWRDVGKTITEVPTGSGSYFLKIDGIVRTEVPTRPSVEFSLPSTSYVICRKDPDTDDMMSDFYYHQPTGQRGKLLVAADAEGCSTMPIAIDMPHVDFMDTTQAFGGDMPLVTMVSIEGDPNVFEAKLLESIQSPYSCSDFKMTWPNFARDRATGLYYVEDRRAELYDNTDASSTQKKRLLEGRCPQSPRTFLNEDTCVPRQDCSPPVYSGEFTLNAQNLRTFYDVDGKYVYRVEDLPLVDTPSPCDSNQNRFVRKNPGQDGNGCVNGITIFPSIQDAIETALSGLSLDTLVVDIEADMGCDDIDDAALGASFTVTMSDGSSSCWTHSYYREWSCFVMNDWVSNHPGNPRFFRESKPNPIAHVAEHENTSGDLDASVVLQYPPWGFHTYNFHYNRWRFESELVGSWGDTIAFNDLPASAKSNDAIAALGGSVIADSSAVIEVCGSPGEVSNDPSLGHQYLLQKYGDADEEYASSLDQDHERWFANHMVFNTVAVNARDQLRHRVAWALSSIFVVTMNDIGREGVEPWAVYYDIFVRNAFGNFFDVLKEVTFSPIMAEMLTYKDSKSLAYQIERNGAELFPDENYSREIMQLFSIGLYMLNQDGTKVIDDATGQPIPTYTNKDVMNFARGFTNFAHQQDERDNIEIEWDSGWIPNAIDPMHLPTSEGRDVFPKQSLNVNGKIGYIGDKVQQCDTLVQTKAWLKKGAVFHFRPNSQSNMGKKDPSWWAEPESWSPRLVLNSATSSLYAKLCNFNLSTNRCDFKSTVVLDEDLVCDGSCDARRATWDWPGIQSPCECSIDEPRTFRLDHSPTSSPVWYEYVRAPCVQMAFVDSGSMNAVREIGAPGYGNKAMCTDNRLPVAGTVCCDANGLNPRNICVFKGERTTYATAKERCAAYEPGWQTCAWDTVPINWDCGTDTAYYEGDWSVDSSLGLRFSWTSEPCSMGVQVDAEGNIAIIHSVGSLDVKERVAPGSGTYFGALWENTGQYPIASANCGGECEVQDNTCVCNNVNVQSTAVFSQLPSVNEITERLHVGASDPRLYDGDIYHLCTAPLCLAQEYTIHFTTLVVDNAGIPGALSTDTIFELTTADGASQFLSNEQSTVYIGSGSYSFRNPPMFNSPVDQTQRDGLYETDAILRQYVDHPNTPPFIATKLINLLVSSNPSTRYVKVAADAFSSGTYMADDQSFGSGKYGDMEALVAAIMLDREARSITLDDDSNHGRAREPLLKVLHMFRSMDLSTISGAMREIDMIYLTERGLGQESFNAPSVFSFFLSEYQPVGPVLDKGLVAPETQLFDAPKLISFVNGLFSLPQFGLTDCQWWQGFGDSRARWYITDYPDGGKFGCNAAQLNNPGVPLRLRYTPPSWGGATNVNNAPVSDVIDDIDLLLTGGRLHSANKAILESVYNEAHVGAQPDEAALRAVLQHYAVAPEFHITNNLLNSKTTTPAERPIPNIQIPQDPPPVTEYKAIVYMFLAGAMDSYSALVPTNCALHSQYLQVRGDVAITNGLRPIDASTSNQPCNTFGLHPSLANIHQLYNDGDASFFANIGPLIEPMNKYEFEAQSKPQPPALFAHNTQTQITQTVFAQDSSAGGVLGRIGDAINEQEGSEVFDAYSISGTPKVLEGAPGVSKPADVLSGWGVASFNDQASPYEDNIEALSKNVASSIYGETYSSSMTNAMYRMRLLDGVIGDTTLINNKCFEDLGTDIAFQLRQVARVIKSRDGLEAKRDVFYTQHGGYDTHSDNGVTLTALLKEVDDAIGCFAIEMKSQGVWDDVTVVSASEFGRTLTSNGLGTDHAWGGNHFIAGGSVKGGRIHGQFPDDLTDNGILNIGRGRLIPTMPWEGLWSGLAEWFGVTSQRIASSVLPNIGNFQENIFGADDLFV